MKRCSILVPFMGLVVTLAGCRHDITDVEPVSADPVLAVSSRATTGSESVTVFVGGSSAAGVSYLEQFTWSVDGTVQTLPLTRAAVPIVRRVGTNPIVLEVRHRNDVHRRLTIPIIGPTMAVADSLWQVGQDLGLRFDPPTMADEEVLVQLHSTGRTTAGTTIRIPRIPSLYGAGHTTYSVPAEAVAAAASNGWTPVLTVQRVRRLRIGAAGDTTLLVARTFRRTWNVKVQR